MISLLKVLEKELIPTLMDSITTCVLATPESLPFSVGDSTHIPFKGFPLCPMFFLMQSNQSILCCYNKKNLGLGTLLTLKGVVN